MLKHGAKCIGFGIVSMAVGVVCAYQVDNAHGRLAAGLIIATLLLCLTGAAVFLLGLYNVIVGAVRRG